MSNGHSIHKLNFEIKGFSNNSEYHHFSDRISAIVRSTLNDKLDYLLSKYTTQGFHIVIQKIELDLGYINLRNMENNILVKIEKFLERQLINIKNRVDYQIKSGKHTFVKIHDENDKQFQIQQETLKKPSFNFDAQILQIIPDKIYNENVIVVPQKAQYLEAILYFLEYGWLPRHLNIPQDEFDKVFTQYILENQDFIIKYFNRKTKKKKTQAINRLQHQITTLPAQSIKRKKINSQEIQVLQKKIHIEQFELAKQTIKRLSTKHEKFTSQEKELIIQVFSSQFLQYHEIKTISKLIDQDIIEDHDFAAEKVEKFNDEFDLIVKKSKNKKLKRQQIPTQKKKVTSIPFPPSERELFEARIKEILDSNDKSTFEKLLETDFYKSITSSYGNQLNQIDILIRSMVDLITTPNKRSEILSSIPDHLDSEKEIINQLYNKNPILLNDVIKNISKFEHSEIRKRAMLISFISKLNKKHVSFIMKSILSKYTRFASILTYINYEMPVSELETDIITLHPKMRTEAEIIILYSIDPITFSSKVTEFIQKSLHTILKKTPQKSQTKKFITKVKEAAFNTRKFSALDATYSLGIKSLIQETVQKNTPEEEAILQFKHLIQENYIPSSSNLNNISDVISAVKKDVKKKNKAEFYYWFDENKILKNALLRKLSRQDFIEILQQVLPTDAHRKYIDLFNRYHFLWKTGVSENQIQIIFLSLIQEHNNINQNNIIPYFFEQLKKYKAWTNEFLRKRVVERYEMHRDYFTEEERERIINYIDQIPTLEGVAMKDTRKQLEQGIPVKNAGLVLLWPFLKTLFQLTDLINPAGEFKSKESRERATLLLQYLAVKSSKVEEPYLALNKILTGFPLEESIPSEIILTEKEKDISDALLLNVIKQWPSFTNSSADNLRGSFIIRDGILSFRNNQWVLKVEAKAYDLLLGKLPWGYTMIRLSWIPYMIKVEWN